jgi:predicted branched-subunit amino acid permease
MKAKALYVLAVAFVMYYGYSLGTAIEDLVAVLTQEDITSLDTVLKAVFLGLIILLFVSFLLAVPDMFRTKNRFLRFKMWLWKFVDESLP